jgi:tetratricopeptide (TPR) repeat protein
MHAGWRPPASRGLVLLTAALLAAGCGTPRIAMRESQGPASLTDDEQRVAQALARYAEGLLFEAAGASCASNAMQAFAEASRLDPARALVNTRTAVTALLQNRPEMAIEALERSCRAFPESVDHYLDLATAYQLAGRSEDAVRTYERVVEIDPAREGAYVAVANLYLLRNRDSEALRVLRRGLRKVPQAGGLIAFAYGQGARLYQEKKIDRAISFFEFVLDASKQKQELQHLIGELYQEAGRLPKALQYYRLAIREPAPVAQAYVKLAIAVYEKSPEEATSLLRQARQRLPDDTLIAVALGQVLASRGRISEALQQYDEVRHLADKQKEGRRRLTKEFYMQHAALLDVAHQGEKAETILEECIQNHPDAAEALNYLAYYWAEKGIHIEKAHEYIQRALVLEPENGAFLDTLGWVDYRLGKYADAALLIQRALDLMPEDATLLEHLGDVLDMLGCSPEATEYWTRSFRADPSRPSAADRLRARGINPDLLRAPPKPGQPPAKAK